MRNPWSIQAEHGLYDDGEVQRGCRICDSNPRGQGLSG